MHFLNQNLIYTPKSAEVKLIASYLEQYSLVCYITDNIAEIENVVKSVKFFLSEELEVITFPAWDTIPYDRVSPSSEVSLRRIEALHKLKNEGPKKKKLFITTAENLTQLVIPEEVLHSSTIEIKLNDVLSRDELLRKLDTIGYIRSATADSVGEYAVRGGIIDMISDASSTLGFRISFFGNNVDSMKLFEVESQLSSGKIDQITIYPVSEVILNDESIYKFKDNYRKLFGITNDQFLESISNKAKYIGMEHYLPLFYKKLSTVFDYLPNNTLILHHDNFESAITNYHNSIEEAYLNKTRVYTAKGERNNALFHDMLYINFQNLENLLERFSAKTLMRFKSDEAYDFYQPIKNIYVEAKAYNKSVLEELKGYIQSFQKEKPNKDTKKVKFIIACRTQGSVQRIKNMLIDYNFHVVEIANYQEVEKIKGKSIGIALIPLEQGFYFENYVFVSEKGLLGEKLTRAVKRKKNQTKFLQEINSLNENELVVHIDHGIGRFQQIETLEVSGAIHDFIKILYRDDDKLYVPVENLDVISKYGGDAHVELDKLGGVNWQARKAKLKERLKLAAEELLKIAAQRSVAEGLVLEPISEIYEKFCNNFPYVETEDQLNAINDVEEDLQKGTPMDRLVCGDVGFGKTEVALRAACIATCSYNPVQIAVIVPTTLLARQHYQNFTERFKDFAIRVAQLSRFVSKKDSTQIKNDLAEGKVDIVIGTHALLASDIKFKNLGLIIIDEEQHFGVAQKEKLKKLKTSTHILTLSATPIPRTLQMSLTGIKDLSLIATPPIDRDPIKTYIIPFDAFTIREAILREKSRGGRVFYVTPRISYIDDLELKLKEIAPEIKVIRAHGKLPPGKLDQIMNDFFDGKFDVLLSTTIVESGLDIPFANTIIIDKADMFGLAQLYQIRGRVGRSNVKAYAYLITSRGYNLNPTAKKRLEVMQSLEGLGSGFSIASHDMDIRGQGNLIGEEQSGNIKEVGIELYQDMLKQAIEALKLDKDSQDEENWSPIINIGVSVQIPESYIEDDSLRIAIYRKIAALSELQELESFAAELIDRFGSLPLEAEQLFAIIKLKQIAKQLNIEKIDLGEKALLISFRNGIPAKEADPLSFVERHIQHAKLRPDGKLLIMQEWKTQSDKIKGIEKILRKI